MTPSPRPWKLRAGVCRHAHRATSAAVVDANGALVADCGCRDLATVNAKVIVRACNNHEQHDLKNDILLAVNKALDGTGLSIARATVDGTDTYHLIRVPVIVVDGNQHPSGLRGDPAAPRTVNTDGATEVLTDVTPTDIGPPQEEP